MVDNKALGNLMKEVSGDRARARMLEAELEVVAEKSYSPRLWAKVVRP